MVWNKYAGMGASRAERVPRPLIGICCINHAPVNQTRRDRGAHEQNGYYKASNERRYGVHDVPPWSVIVIYNKGLYNRQRITEQVCILHDHCNSVKSEQALTGWCFPEWECARRKGGVEIHS